MTSYKPAALIRLVFRFEEYDSATSAKPPDKVQTKRRGAKDEGYKLEYVLDPNNTSEGKRYTLQGKRQETDEASEDNLTYAIEGIVPMRATLERNSYKEADTLEIDIPFLDLPFDPRTIRSCGVQYYLGTLTDEIWKEGVSNNQIPKLPLEDDYGSNLRFEGWVDDYRSSWADGQTTVTLSCRDNTSLLIDQPAPPQLKIDPKKTLDEAFADYLASFPQFAGLAVEYRPSSDDAPRLADIANKASQRNGGTGPGKDKMSVWDYLTDVAGMAGCVLFFEGSTIVIQKPRTLYGSEVVREGDPWEGLEYNGAELENRTLIYGENVESFEVSRRFNENAPRNIELRCYLPSRKKTLVARFPGVTSKVQPGEKADKSILVLRVSGVASKDALKVIAQSVYEDMSRQELAVSIKTKHLASLGGSNSEPDLLYLQSGDPVEVLFASKEGDAEVPSSPEQLEGALLIEARTIEFLSALGYEKEIAAAYAKAYVAAGYQTIFRVQKAMIDWSSEEGVSISIDATNYVQARYDVPLPEGLEPDAT
jgi:hypothetical protein